MVECCPRYKGEMQGGGGSGGGAKCERLPVLLRSYRSVPIHKERLYSNIQSLRCLYLRTEGFAAVPTIVAG